MEIETDDVDLSTVAREQPVGANSSPVMIDQPLSQQVSQCSDLVYIVTN
jgi:hypothetical protein